MAAALAGAGCAVDLPAAAPLCDATEVLTLMAQALPEARQLPCLTELPEGWSAVTFEVESGEVRFALSHPVAGDQAVRVRLAADCRADPGDGSDPTPVPLDPHATEERLEHDDEGLRGQRFDGLDGGCVTRTYAVVAEGWEEFAAAIDDALVLVDRSEVAALLREESGGRLDLDAVG